MAHVLETIVRISAEVGNGFSKVGSTLTELGSIVDGLSAELIDFGEESVGVYRDYEKNMQDAEVALSTTYGQGTQRLQRVMEQLDDKATGWAADTIFHTNDVSGSISEAAHAGWDYQQIMAGIPASMRLAQAGNLGLSKSVDYVVKSTNAANIGFENMDHWIDLWTYAANSSASDIGEFGDAMLRMGSTMRFAANPEELMTLIAVTADAGAVGSEAGTMIRNSFMRLIAPTDKAKDAMAEMGATSEEMSEILNDEALAAANAELASRGFTVFDQSTGELRPMLDIYSNLGDVLAGIAGGYDKISKNAETTELLGAIFPTRTITEALNLINAAADGYGGLYDQLMAGEAEGYGQYAAETMMDTLNGDIEIFESKVERLKQVLGEELKGQVEGVAGFLGNIADSIAELEPDKFAALTGAAETLALAGPGLLTAGTALRLIGLVFGTTGGAIAAGALAVAAGLGALIAWDAEQFDENFGTMNLDLAELDRNLDSLTTDGEDRLAAVDGYVKRLGELAEEYRNAADGFNQEITMATLTGKTLTKDERDQIVALGESMTAALIEGITTRRESDLALLNAVTPSADDMSSEDYDAYLSLFDMLGDYYGDLVEEASGIGVQMQQAILDALNNDGVIDQAEREAIQKYSDMLNNIEAQIAAQQDQASYYAELEKASRVSLDNIEEYMGELEENQRERLASVEDTYAGLIGDARTAYEAEHGKITDAEWESMGAYKLLATARDQAIKEVQDQVGQLAATAMQALLSDSDMGDTWQAVLNLAAGHPDGDFGDMDLVAAVARGMLPESFFDDLDALNRGSGPLGMSGSQFKEMLEPYIDVPGVKELYDLFGSGGIIEAIAGRYTENRSMYDDWGYNYVDVEQGTALPMPIRPYVEGEDAVAALQDQGVDVAVNGDTTEIQADLDGIEGQTLMEYLDGDATDLDLVITDRDGKILTEVVDGDTTELARAINQFQGQVVHVNIRAANGTLPGAGTGAKEGYATGGRATTASIFAEAGPEWAIPEEHTDRTAALLDAARAASGFTWPDLLGRLDATGDGGTRTSDQTFIYAPVIHAQDATGVEAVLRQDKDRLTKWWEEKRLRDALEVYQ